MQDSISTERVVIVGAGLAALYAALDLAPRPVVVISPEPLGQGASSVWAQGGVAAAMGKGDTPKSHADDTTSAGAGTVIAEVAEHVTKLAREHILELTELGTPFDRTKSGGYVLSREAAHSVARVVRVKGDQAGRQIMETLIDEVHETPSIQLLEGMLATKLETEGDSVIGVWVAGVGDPETAPVLLRAPAVLLAGGGSGGLFAHTTNPPRIRGQVIGMAARAGAKIADAEFVQFHPTAIDSGEDPAPLATEALRGEGAILINAAGERFMTSIHPDAELAPRDIVARAIFAQSQANKRPMLDTRAALGAEVNTLYPAVAEACARAGIDPVADPIPVAVAAHYHMGGVDTDLRGRASLKNLWVCGEASSTGLHGANRLASNGLLEALVYARICAENISDHLGDITYVDRVAIGALSAGAAVDEVLVSKLRGLMNDHVGVLRTESGLKQALVGIAELEEKGQSSSTFLNMTTTATLIAAGALQREESRGGHYRTDYPEARVEFEHRSETTFAEAFALRTKIVEEFK
ncbi:L-aspartate oxidase [Cochlodiniinecator piscidefendens]|uniref:L-aspartate oxidase n=1 Tax=Cochlodiniinecator piscidefendens TaxID=2715756 RepID=UPI002F429EE8